MSYDFYRVDEITSPEDLTTIVVEHVEDENTLSFTYNLDNESVQVFLHPLTTVKVTDFGGPEQFEITVTHRVDEKIEGGCVYTNRTRIFSLVTPSDDNGDLFDVNIYGEDRRQVFETVKKHYHELNNIEEKDDSIHIYIK